LHVKYVCINQSINQSKQLIFDNSLRVSLKQIAVG